MLGSVFKRFDYYAAKFIKNFDDDGADRQMTAVLMIVVPGAKLRQNTLHDSARSLGVEVGIELVNFTGNEFRFKHWKLQGGKERERKAPRRARLLKQGAKRGRNIIKRAMTTANMLRPKMSLTLLAFESRRSVNRIMLMPKLGMKITMLTNPKN